MVSTALSDRWYDVVAKPRRFPFARGACFVAVLALILAGLNLYAPGSPTLAERLLSTSTLAIAALPLWLWLSGVDRGIPFMPFFGMVYAVYYAVPFFLLKSYSREMFGAPFSDSLMTRALGVVFAGLLAALLGYYGPQHLAVARILPKPRFCWCSLGNVKLWAMVFSLVGLPIYMLKATITLPLALDQFALFGGDLSSIGICILFVLQLTSRLDRPSVVFLWSVLVPLRMLLGLSTGETAQVFGVLLMLLTAYAAVRRTMPWKMLVLGAVALLLVRPAMTPLRALTWKGGRMYRASRVEKVKLAYTAVAQTAGGGVPYDLVFQYSLSRIAVDLMTLPEVTGPEHNEASELLRRLIRFPLLADGDQTWPLILRH